MARCGSPMNRPGSSTPWMCRLARSLRLCEGSPSSLLAPFGHRGDDDEALPRPPARFRPLTPKQSFLPADPSVNVYAPGNQRYNGSHKYKLWGWNTYSRWLLME